MEDSRGGRRRSARGSGGGGVVVASGSGWESRMKLDEVRGGMKVFNGGDKEIGAGSARKSSVGARTWRSEIDLERNKTVAKVRPDSLRLSSSDSENSPIQAPAARTTRSGRRLELGLGRSVDGGGIETLARGRRKLQIENLHRTTELLAQSIRALRLSRKLREENIKVDLALYVQIHCELVWVKEIEGKLRVEAMKMIEIF